MSVAKQQEPESVEKTGIKMSDAKQQEQESVETATVETTSQQQQEPKFTLKKQTLKYDIDTLISPSTNRLVKDGEKPAMPPVFWCDVCSVKLTPPMAVISHFNGKAHSVQVSKNQYITPIQVSKNKGTTQNATLKRIHADAKSSSEPSEKVTKKDEDPGLTCTDCKITFQNYKSAAEHYKGKRHLKRMKEILAPKVSAPKVSAPKVSAPNRGRGNYSNAYNNRFNSNMSAGNYSEQQKAAFYNKFGAYLNKQRSSFGSLNQSSSYNSLDQPGGYSSLDQRNSYGDLNQRSSFSSQSSYGLTSGTGLLNDESNFRSMSGNQQSYDNFSSSMNSRFNLSSILPSSNNNFWRN